MTQHRFAPAPSLDPEFILYEFLTGPNQAKIKSFQEAKGATVSSGHRSIFRRTASRLKQTLSPAPPVPIPNPGQIIWCHTTTQNQTEMLAPVHRALGERSSWWDLFNPYLAWRRLSNAEFTPDKAQSDNRLKQNERAAAIASPTLIDIYAVALAEAELLVRTLSSTPPKAVLTTNDHSPRHMALRYATHVTGVPLVYLQHAATGGLEPALSGYTAALLQGHHAAELYRQQGSLPQDTYLVGSPKLDQTNHQQSGRSRPQGIGLCPGLEAKPEKTLSVIETVRAALPDSISLMLRLHPRMGNLDAWAKVISCVDHRSDAASVSVTTFLNQCRVIVADDSNIAIEALACNCQPIRTAFGAEIGDQYQISASPFFQNWTASHEQLEDKIKQAFDQSENTGLKTAAKAFYANIDTVWDNRSASLIAAILIDLFFPNDRTGKLALTQDECRALEAARL